MKKHMIASIFLLLLMVTVFTITATAAEIVSSGYCGGEGDGKNLSWVLTRDGMLTISGFGKMRDYEDSGEVGAIERAPWYDDRESIKTVVMEIGITSIGNLTFSGCSNLTSVTIPANVTSIGNSAFYSCSSLTSVTIPASVTSIDNHAFSWCSSLTSVMIPASVTSIGNHVFSCCAKLSSISVASGNARYSAENGILFSKDRTLLHSYPAGKSETTYVIPASVTSIGESAFSGCSGLTSVAIPNSVTSIEWMAFSGCSGLTSVVIPNSVTSIGGEAFAGCSGLTNVVIPNSVTSIAYGAFAGCSGLTSVTIPNGVTSIGGGAFSRCSELTSVTIPNGVTSIGGGAFSGCNKLTSVVIPNSVTSIGGSAFSDCSGLTNIVIPNSVTSIEWRAFYGCSELKSIIIPNRTTSIGFAMFALCNKLGSVTIPISVTSIERQAFSSCDALTDIYYAGSKTQWEQISINSGNEPLQNATIHYNSSGSDAPALAPVQTKVPSGQYCIHVIDEKGKPLKGATVYWEDSAEVLTDDTNANGDVYFMSFTLGAPKIDVSLTGYTSWTNRNSNWSKSDKQYSIVKLYPEEYGAYKLSVARYSNSSLMTTSVDLLTQTKQLSLKNTGNLIGDLDFGNFYLSCSANDAANVARYTLYQNNKEIASCTSGFFGKLSVDSFSKGGGCFIRVIAKSGEEVDTAINLQFAENAVNKENKYTWKGDAVTFQVKDDVPFLGGSSIKFDLPIDVPIVYVQSESKTKIGFNIKMEDGKSADEQMDEYLKTLDKAYHYGNTTLKDSKSNMSLLKKLVQKENEVEWFKKCSLTFAGYVELPNDSSVAEGYLAIIMNLKVFSFEYNTVVVVVPVTVQIGVDFSLDLGSKVNYDLKQQEFTNANLMLNPSIGLNAFGGVGVSTLVGVGAYGGATLDVKFNLFGSEDRGLRSADLTGELGLKAYLASFTYQRAFAHNTWHLYTANATLSGADWHDSLYDASEYKPDDLGYLIAESEWMGDTASLLEASEQTEQASLLSDTYRNAQPVMIATDNALYAAFVRADTGSGQRYVVLTKFDGSSWREPVQVDTNAILDNSPVLCTDGNKVYLAYARATENPGDSLLSYALKQQIVVGSVNPDTLSFTEQATFSGVNPDSSFVYMPQLGALNGQVLLAWADSAVNDDNSVLRPVSSTIRYAACSDGIWGNASNMRTVNAPVDSITIGERNAAPAIACLLDENSERNLYLLTANGQERIAENVSGTVTYARLPGTDKVSFLWNGENVLTSSDGNSAEVPGISGEYAVSGNNVYYSAATDGGANLIVLQYHVESETWGLPIQLTGGNRYLENLSVASLNGTDYVLGMHTSATITENAVEDAKNLVWAVIRPVSDLCLDGIDYDAENVKAGESLPVTLTVINAGDHTVNRIAVTLNNSAIKTQECSLKPGESLDIEVSVSAPSSLSEYLFTVEEPDHDDHSPDDNEATVQIGYADAAIELEYQQIGAKKALMATVTNRGVETASGSVAFYDANGSSVAESAFTNLASGDTTIAVYELDGNFAGINGGDVSAKVTLEQEELYTYNNADTLHIMEAESNPEKTEIVSAVANGERGLSADIACESELTATAYCAFYNRDGKMLSVEIWPLSTGRNSLTFTASNQTASKAKIFVLDNQMIPQCASNAVEIT